MEAIIKQAEELLLPPKFNQNLTRHFHSEKLIPDCVRGTELTQKYNQTDLDFTYVFAKCKELKQLKDIDLPLQRIEAFYVEFIQMGWTKKIFDLRFEAVKKAKLYGGVFDLSTWLESDITYTQYDFEIKLKERIEAMIREGEKLSMLNVKLSPDETQCAKLWAYKKIKMQCDNRRSELLEQHQEQEEERLNKILKEKRLLIRSLTDKEKVKLLEKALAEHKIKPVQGFEFNAIVKHLEDYADLIPRELIEKL